MFENYFYGLLVFSCVLIFLLLRNTVSLWKQNNLLRGQNVEANLRLKRDLEESLDLATTEQLLKELRERKGMPYIILFPIKEKDYNGITIESHGINQVSCFAMLHLAKAITAQNFKKNGIDPPRLPPLNDYFN